MKRFFFFTLILLLPVCSWAAYKIYLNNGSVISGASSYEEAGDEVEIYFNTGSMTVPKKDIRKIEGNESPETTVEKTPEVGEQNQESSRETPAQAPSSGSTPSMPEDDKSSRRSALQTELNSVNSDIRSTGEEEARLAAAINEKTGSRPIYNVIQQKQLEKELEPLKQERSAVQQKKADLVKRRSDIEAELKSQQ